MRGKAPIDWAGLRALALSFGLPRVEDAVSWGQPCLKAHKKLWVWWSPSAFAPVFKVPLEEREMLCDLAPDRFFFTDHYKSHPLVLMRADAFDAEWARGNLLRNWRAGAPKRLLAEIDADPALGPLFTTGKDA